MGTIRARLPDDHASTEDCAVVHLCELPDKCRICGEKRGRVRPYQIKICGIWVEADRWSNACGHQEYYFQVIKEAKICSTRRWHRLSDRVKAEVRQILKQKRSTTAG